MHNSTSLTRVNSGARAAARGLGWFSLALGLAELAAPRAITRHIGSPGPEALVRAYGLREILAGAAILASDRPVAMTWMRVAGDAVDLATLMPAMSRDNPHRRGAEAALGFVAVATAADIGVAMQGDHYERDASWNG